MQHRSPSLNPLTISNFVTHSCSSMRKGLPVFLGMPPGQADCARCSASPTCLQPLEKMRSAVPEVCAEPYMLVFAKVSFKPRSVRLQACARALYVQVSRFLDEVVPKITIAPGSSFSPQRSCSRPDATSGASRSAGPSGPRLLAARKPPKHGAACPPPCLPGSRTVKTTSLHFNHFEA